MVMVCVILWFVVMVDLMVEFVVTVGIVVMTERVERKKKGREGGRG